MLSEELKDAIVALTPAEKEEVRQLLLDYHTSDLPAEERLKVLVDLMEKASGEKIDMVSRKEPLPNLRAIIATTMIEEGYTYEQIAGAMHKNRTIIYHFREVVDMIRRTPKAYPIEARILQVFGNELYNYNINENGTI